MRRAMVGRLLMSCGSSLISGCMLLGLVLAACSRPECEPKAPRCNGAYLERCTALGKWAQEADCSALGQTCVSTEGGPGCGNLSLTGQGGGGGFNPPTGSGAGGGPPCGNGTFLGSRGCNGHLVVECTGFNTWSKIADCAQTGQTCVSAACAPEQCGGVPEGSPAFRCVGQVSQICAGVFDTYADCAARGSACDPTTGRCHTAAACTAGAERCTGDDEERCVDGGWALVERCSYTARTCMFQPEADCVGTRRCITGERRCGSDNIETCANGVFTELEDCVAEGRVCELFWPDGGAGPVCNGRCQPGTVICNVDVARVCVNGTFVTEDCGAMGQVCDPLGPAACRVCDDGTSRCRGTNVEMCNSGAYQSQACPNGCQASSATTAQCL